jgi:SAM-dependent methyltransferase
MQGVLMDGMKRLNICRKMAVDKRLLGLPLKSVRDIDDYMQNEWKIAPPTHPENWDSELRRVAGADLCARFKYLYDRQADYLSRGKTIPQDIETRFYDVIADPRISGFIHSQKRTYILDTAALLMHLVSKLEIAGPILDIGCHVGYHSILLNREFDHEVHGIDLSKSAISIAKQRAAQGARIHFDNMPLESESLRERFDFVYAANSIKLDAKSLRVISRTLKPNGVAVIVRGKNEDFGMHRTGLLACGLGFGFADVIGGWLGDARGFEAEFVLVLIKGIDSVIPDDIDQEAESGWNNHFKEYANTPGIPSEEKTQAYFRGRYIEGHSANSIRDDLAS